MFAGYQGGPMYSNRWHACYWSPGTTNASVVDLLTLRSTGWKSEALWINDSNKVVGWSWSSTNSSSQRAVIWENPTSPNPVDLNDAAMVHAASGWVLKSAEGINNLGYLGYIIGSGTYNGTSRAFLLVPNQ